MSNDTSKTFPLKRRKVLAALGAASAALIGGGNEILRTVTTDQQGGSSLPPTTESRQQEEDPPVETPPGENIVDYGAEPNPDDPSLRDAQRNLTALRAAANTAGKQGTVYIPAGSFYIGDNTTERGILNAFGLREPAGISFVGDGPNSSMLALSEHMPDSQNHNGFVYWEDHNHGRVQFKDICLDGNYERVGNLSAAKSGSRGIVFKEGAQGSIDLFNVYIRCWYTNGIYVTGIPGSIKHCTFEENGIGLNQDTNGRITSHHSAIRPSNGEEFVLTKCYFNRCSGSAVNIGKNQGDVTLRECYGKGLGSGVHKITGGNIIRNINCYWEPNTEWLVNNLPNGEPEFHGNNIAHRLADRVSGTPRYILDNVEVWGTTGHAIETRANTVLSIEGDLIAIHNSALSTDRDSVLRDDEDGELREVDIDRLSVHDSDANVFSTPHASGEIRHLARNNTRGLGITGALVIGEDDKGAEPFEPEIPSREDVGIIESSGDS